MRRNGKFEVPEDEYAIETRPLRYPNLTSDIALISEEQLIFDEENSDIYGAESSETVKELANEMKRNGFQGTIMAYPITTGMKPQYKVESGHRRLMAARAAGIKSIPVSITKPPVTDAERRLRLIAMNLHSRGPLLPSVTARIINTLMESNKAEQERKNLPTDKATLIGLVASQMELSEKSITKYRQFYKIVPELKDIADSGVSWSALVSCSSLPEDIQRNIAATITAEIKRVGAENVSRPWILALIDKIKSGEEPKVKAKVVVKRRDGAKIISKYVKEFDDIINGTAVVKEADKKDAIENLLKIRENINKALERLSD